MTVREMVDAANLHIGEAPRFGETRASQKSVWKLSSRDIGEFGKDMLARKR